MSYWLSVRRHFEALRDFDISRAGERVSVTIPRENVLDRRAMLALAREKNARMGAAGRLVFHVV